MASSRRPVSLLLAASLLTSSGHVIRIFHNGDDHSISEPLLTYDDEEQQQAKAWQEVLHAAFPNADRLALWTADGHQIASSTLSCRDRADKAACREWAASGQCEANPGYMLVECERSCGVGSKCHVGSSSRYQVHGSLPRPDPAFSGAQSTPTTLYMTTDHFPFVWPSVPGVTTAVALPADLALPPLSAGENNRTSIHLRAIGTSPRVFEAVEVASSDEVAAIMRLAQPLVKASVTYTGGSLTQNEARTSDTGWLRLPAEGATGDEAMLRRVWLRLASLARVDLRASENMQAIHYGEGAHYHYHIDTGGSPIIASRAVTALLYLNDGFEGGETNFAIGGAAEAMRNVHKVRHEFDGCQTKQGYTIRPRAGHAALFYNLMPNSMQKDFFSWHASCDVFNGQKWSANLWLHAGDPSLLEQRLRPPARPKE